MYFLKTVLNPDPTFPLWTFSSLNSKMSAPELQSVRPQINASHQEQQLVKSQQKAIDNAAIDASGSVIASAPMVLNTESVMKNLPVSMAVSLSEFSTVSTSSAPLNVVNFPSELVVVKCTDSSMSGGQVVSSSHSETQTKVHYNLSEAVMKEREALFKCGMESRADSQMFELEPPRAETQTVRMRSKKFFALMEEEEEEAGTNKPTQQASNQDPSLVFPAVPPIKYTPIFNFGQSLHQVFHSQKIRRQRPNMAATIPTTVEETGDKVVADPNTQEAVYSRATSGYESDPEPFVQLYEKITMNPRAIRRNASQPNLVKSCADEASEFDDQARFGGSKSQSMPNTPKVSPRVRRRNSATAQDIVKPEKMKPEATGPGLSFLASVAGELRAHKKTNPNKVNLDKVIKDGQIAKAPATNPDIQVSKPEPYTNKQTIISHDSTNSKVATSENKILKKPERGQLFKKGQKSNAEPLPSTSPKRSNPLAEMSQAEQTTQKETVTKRSSFMKSIVDWSTTPLQVTGERASNKEHNIYSPTSF